MIFYNYSIDCLIREHTIEIALLGRICLFIIFSYRLYFSFKESTFAYPTNYLILFTLIGFIVTNSTLIYFFMQVMQHRSNNNDKYSCTNPGFSTTKAILPYFLCEFTFNAILVFLFCRKLIKSLRLLLQLSGGGVQMNLQVLQTIQLMSKMTLLMGMIFVSTILILSVMTSYLSSACISLDNVVNVICMLLVFKHNEKYYNSMCCLCNKFCVQFCLFFCMNGIKLQNDHHHNDNNNNNIMSKVEVNQDKIERINDLNNNNNKDIMEGRVTLDIINEYECELNVKSSPENTPNINGKMDDNDDDDISRERGSSAENDNSNINANNEIINESEAEYEVEEFDFINDEKSLPTSPNESYIDTLAVIFLNECSSNSKYDDHIQLPVPIFLD